ncbi:helix-turn-helix domain-containing protein [Yinghuangia sp. ASG 101]|uniref:helix-turn-helix transcriptional regulator n=1 Tax=Yinghuangia sp. ASG 101 TaxID=2896848 RepID=UPI001E62E23C|nr:helix-turn-helix domain-containing protein [Yinghuangia sp. ASG 101]UGQ10901.1 helix-turn-helix domain-containing protein [Yinghuangia sp. ASG 101]
MTAPRLLDLTRIAQLVDAAATHGAEETTGPDLLHSGWYETDDVAALLDIDPSTLRRWRTLTPPQGPPFVQFSNRVTKYSVPDVQAWLASRRFDPAKAA